MRKVLIEQAKIDKIWNYLNREFLKKNNINKLMDVYPDRQFFDKLMQIDPTNKTKEYKYYSFMQDLYLNDIVSESNIDELQSQIEQLEQEFRNNTKLDIKTTLKDAHQSSKPIQFIKDFVNSIREKNNEKQKRKETLKSVDKNETDNWYFINQTTREEQIKYGQNTKWCIQMGNKQEQTFEYILNHEYEDIWSQDKRMKQLLNKVFLQYGMTQRDINKMSNNDRKKQFILLQKKGLQYKVGKDIDDLDPKELMELVLDSNWNQYKEIEYKNGDGKVWIIISKIDPNVKFCFIFGCGEYRDTLNKTIDLKQLFNGEIDKYNKLNISEIHGLLTNLNSKGLPYYKKQYETINNQMKGKYIPTLVDIFIEEMDKNGR